MIRTASSLAETAHRLTRKGRELHVQVLELADVRDGGYVLVFGEIADDCLVRIHSRCLYGDALRSDDCDCGPELDKAMDLIQEEGSGVLVYLEQEGRGAGLIAKARGLRDGDLTGADTFTSYRTLGFPEDSRSYELAAKTLAALGLSAVRLLTNNPEKAHALRAANIAVTAVPLLTRARSARARQYLEAKRKRRRHWIPVEAEAPWAIEASIAIEDTAILPALPDDPRKRRIHWLWFSREGGFTARRRARKAGLVATSG
ncbi:GTP cyclohydrolase II [Nocardia sp. XZ_19_385]|uniref:GTP cyclohydrolase II n=1 Tax=Nocardia sp. XZ_19_385 TaxID=2769488 RepID=UPI00188F8CC2|nr:GTP cyclohydrolase II [Nocardia sp. XZ_19_385]